MLSRRALSDVWSGGTGAGGAGAARTERFLHVGQALKLDAVLRGDAPTSLVSMGKEFCLFLLLGASKYNPIMSLIIPQISYFFLQFF